MYNDMYDTFDNKKIPYDYPHSFQEDKHFDYLNKTKPTYEMDFQDTPIIPFQIGSGYQNYYINIIVYNFRHEEIYCTTQLPDPCGRVYLNITDDISSTIFKRGMYYIQVQAEGMVGLMVTVTTLISSENCTLFVR